MEKSRGLGGVWVLKAKKYICEIFCMKYEDYFFMSSSLREKNTTLLIFNFKTWDGFNKLI